VGGVIRVGKWEAERNMRKEKSGWESTVVSEAAHDGAVIRVGES